MRPQHAGHVPDAFARDRASRSAATYLYAHRVPRSRRDAGNLCPRMRDGWARASNANGSPRTAREKLRRARFLPSRGLVIEAPRRMLQAWRGKVRLARPFTRTPVESR